MLLVLVTLPAPARGQSEEGELQEIPVHPNVTTVVSLPDEIELARVTGRTTGMMQATRGGKLVHVQPRASLRPGTEVLLYVQTATVRRRFRLRVVRRARDASERVMVSGPDPELISAASASAGTPVPPLPDSSRDSGRAGDLGEEIIGPAPVAIRSRRPEISAHLLGSAGFTGLDVPGYQPSSARQFHAGFGARLRVTRPDASWALEANIITDLLDGPMSFKDSRLETR
jgi:hypothetical protein